MSVNDALTPEKADRIKRFLDDNMTVEEVSELLNVNPIIVAYLDHSWISDDVISGKVGSIETISDLVRNSGNIPSMDDDNDRRQLASRLTRLGMPQAQIHAITRLTMHSVQTVIRNEKSDNPEDIHKNRALPNNITCRIIASIFTNHYNQIRDELLDVMSSVESEVSDFDRMDKVIAAWLRTMDEVKNSRLKMTLNFLRENTDRMNELEWDDRFIGLGALFPIAHSLKLNSYRSQKTLVDQSCKVVEEADCTVKGCGAHYVYFTGDNNSGKDGCPFCELESLINLGIANRCRKLQQGVETAGNGPLD